MKKDLGNCIFNHYKKCTNCLERQKEFAKNLYDLTDEFRMNIGYRLIKGFNMLRENE